MTEPKAMSENEKFPEAQCSQGGDHGLCKTHPTCELTLGEIRRLRAEVEREKDFEQAYYDEITLREEVWKPLLGAFKEQRYAGTWKTRSEDAIARAEQALKEKT